MSEAKDFRPRFECGNPCCGHLSTRHKPQKGGGPCDFRGCDCRRLVVPFTPRDFQILKLLAGGGGSKVVAGMLGISPKTVYVHLANMRAKSGLGFTMDLILAALRADLITIDDLPAAPHGILAVKKEAA